MSDSSPPTPNNNITTATNNKTHSPSLIICPCQTKLEETPTLVETMKAENVDSNYDAAAMKRSVKEINFGGHDEKAAAAAEIKRLAKADGRTKRLLAELGIVPPLVAMMVEHKELRCRRLAVDALVELASGSFRNKKLIVEAGLLSKLPQLMRSKALARDRQLALLLCSVSSLAKTQFPLDPRRFLLPFLVEILDDEDACEEVKRTCVATLYNLSAKLDNARPIVASGAVRSLLKLVSTSTSASEGALATLGNLAASATGKDAIGNEPSVVEALAEILAWDDKPRCQELAAYLLMVVAHRSAAQREMMSRSAGVVPRLLEVALLGSPLARKRALKLLQWFKDDRGTTRVAAHSGPQAQARMVLRCSSSPMAEEDVEEGRRAVRAMVKQSLDRNMETITRRAAGVVEGPLGIKSLVATSSSKSLPY
ncbi:uncharacterized protein M6B38_125040 [Iris pallida]|uniref:U-box domain-containing protein n=1 Tax=Iris pallida TaxID=29817 RepID=A0AAX6GVG9_IRIPA|nr:uncharacterized protein M6B38_125040 [Iris pallida]